MGVIIDHGSYELKGKLTRQAEIIGPAMNANNVRKAPLGQDGEKKLYLVRRHAEDHKEENIIGSHELVGHGSFLIAEGL